MESLIRFLSYANLAGAIHALVQRWMEATAAGDVDAVLALPETNRVLRLVVPALGCVFTGDTLFQGGPGATGRSFSDFPTIIDSIRDDLLTLHDHTIVLTGHGDATSIGAEKPHRQRWVDEHED